jgi:hypothetical protein
MELLQLAVEAVVLIVQLQLVFLVDQAAAAQLQAQLLDQQHQGKEMLVAQEVHHLVAVAVVQVLLAVFLVQQQVVLAVLDQQIVLVVLLSHTQVAEAAV